MTETTIPEGYMEDSQGRHVPISKVKPQHLEEDTLVREAVAGAKLLHQTLAEFKSEVLAEAAAFRAKVAEAYGAKKGGAKGNMTLKSYDGRYELQVAVADQVSFGPELQAAKELIDNCLTRWAAGSNENLHALVNDAFNVGKAGRIDTGRVLGLRRLDIHDAEWLRAMDAISDAVRVSGTRTYIRFYERHPETGQKTAISLDIAVV